MYTILVNESNELVTSVRERIMQRSKLVDNFHFLVDKLYKGIDMSDFTVMMEYILPVSREYTTEILVKSDELYKEKLEYKLPFDTSLTKEAGDIEVQLTFIKVSLDVNGNSKQQVRKTSPTTITIVPISAWSNIIADSALTALDQRLIQVDAMLNAANEFNQYLYETKADNIYYDEEGQYIQLTANGQPIGDKVTLCVNSNGYGVVNVEIDGNSNLIVSFTDGKTVNAGYVGGDDGAVFIPHISDDYILSWTCTKDLPCPDPIDLNCCDEWQTLPGEGIESDYIWEFI